MTRQWWIALALTALGAWLRFRGLGDRPLWVDEALFGYWVRENNHSQEWITIAFARLIGANTEFEFRFLSALCGTLTITAMWFVSRNLYAAGLVSVFPLFTFWSTLARPYAVAGLFVVLAWRWWWFYLVAVVITPLSVLGLRITRKRLWIPALAVVAAVGIFLLRPDVNRGWTVDVFLQSSRMWYIPALALILYAVEYVKKSESRA